MKIKTRESLKTIKTFDRAETLAQKSQSGVSSLHNSAEQTQNIGYESETDYAGSELQDKEERIARSTVMGADRVGRWGVRETRKNIHNLRNRPRKKPNLKLKQLPSPKRKALPAAKKGVKTASKSIKTSAKATVKGSKAAVKASVKAARLLKKAITATVKFIKLAIKAIIAAGKAVVAAVKGIIAAIAAGGWIVVLIIIVIVIIGVVVGAVVNGVEQTKSETEIQEEITLYSVKNELISEYTKMQNDLISNSEYDEINYEGNVAKWSEMICVYLVKLNIDSDDPKVISSMDEQKASELKTVFWDMNTLYAESIQETKTVTREETDESGNVVEITENITVYVLSVVTERKTIDEIADFYGFNSYQKEKLSELISKRTAELWDYVY